MLNAIVKQTKTAFILLLLFTVLTGLIYPVFVTGFAQLLFPWQANGSVIMEKNQPVGSFLIGQSFTEPKYFWGRPSATSPFPYNAANSGGSNQGPSNPGFLTALKNKVISLHQSDTKNLNLIPVDLVTASASGLDPDISPLAALYQVRRIAKVRKIPEQKIQALIYNSIQFRYLGLLGEPRINVLLLNIALDSLHDKTTS